MTEGDNNGECERGADSPLLDDLDFGENDEDLLSALQPKRKPERTLDVTELFEGLEAEAEGESDASEGTVVLSPSSTATLDMQSCAPETMTLVTQAGATEPPASEVQADALEAAALDVRDNGSEAAMHGTRAEALDTPIRGGRKPSTIVLTAVAVVAIAAAIAIGGFIAGGFLSGSSEDGDASQVQQAGSDEKTYSLVVEYRDAQTGEMLQSSLERDVTEGEMPESVKSRIISGYEVVSGTDNGYEFYTAADRGEGESAEVDLASQEPGNHRVVFAYAKQVGYTVRYLENGTDVELAPLETTGGKLAGESVTVRAREVEGFDLDGEPEVTITLNNDEGLNVITFRYNKKPEPAPARDAVDGGSRVATFDNSSVAPGGSTPAPSGEATQPEEAGQAEEGAPAEEEVPAEEPAEAGEAGVAEVEGSGEVPDVVSEPESAPAAPVETEPATA